MIQDTVQKLNSAVLCPRCFHWMPKYRPNGYLRLYCSSRCIARRPRPDMMGNRWGAGYKHTPEQRAHQAEITKGFWTRGILKPVPAWNKGKPWLAAIRLKMSLARYGKGRKLHPITPLVRLIRESNIYQKWRTGVYERDNYTCVLCGARSEVGNRVLLNADHFPDEFSTLIKTNHITSYTESLGCERLWDINNGRTLCLPCHKLRHAKSHG